MKNFIYLIAGLFLITACQTAPCECEAKGNGFIDGTGQSVNIVISMFLNQPLMYLKKLMLRGLQEITRQ